MTAKVYWHKEVSRYGWTLDENKPKLKTVDQLKILPCPKIKKLMV